MLPTKQGSIRLFRLAGITVFLHWSWILFVPVRIGMRAYQYTSLTWNVVEYLALFLIVLMHEFGHSLACRQVGGQADQIILWPLGGVAYVAPPQRPGATLWSIAAGPLVNLILLPVLTGLIFLTDALGLQQAMPNAAKFLNVIWTINLVLLIFNLLPIYPLDGGQILRSLLWFVLGRAQSLFVASIIGFLGVIGLIPVVLWNMHGEASGSNSVQGYIWIAVLGFFVLLNCWRGFQEARALSRFEKLPRHAEYACPACKAAPPLAPMWLCGNCRNRCDIFQTLGQCPHCGAHFTSTRCLDCGVTSPIGEWIGRAPPMPQR
ncbi:MAG: Peptidase [Pedosphaera sp.]|nr:Peptidase [Pedosphaera sp.]